MVLMLLSTLLLPPVAFAQVVELAAGSGEVPLSPHVRYLHDPEASDRTEDAWRRVDGGHFVPLPDGSAAFGFQRGAFWFHVRVRNRDPAEGRWLLAQRLHRRTRAPRRWQPCAPRGR